jgi:hypothetical protein
MKANSIVKVQGNQKRGWSLPQIGEETCRETMNLSTLIPDLANAARYLYTHPISRVYRGPVSKKTGPYGRRGE